jgi:hypothetical protein
VKMQEKSVYIKAQTPFGTPEGTLKMCNEWPVSIPPDWDRNFDRNSFEIVDNKMLPIFQARYNSPNMIEVYGIFVSPAGGITIAFGHSLESVRPGFPVPAIPERKAWFKYPSKSHLGEHVEAN